MAEACEFLGRDWQASLLPGRSKLIGFFCKPCKPPGAASMDAWEHDSRQRGREKECGHQEENSWAVRNCWDKDRNDGTQSHQKDEEKAWLSGF